MFFSQSQSTCVQNGNLLHIKQGCLDLVTSAANFMKNLPVKMYCGAL